VIGLVVAALLALAACSPARALRSPCEQKCYGQKTVEPQDFDDCIKRCNR
jgi:hypothetical protein